jgi:aspartate/tyrosine/aromatic aminotransferase
VQRLSKRGNDCFPSHNFNLKHDASTYRRPIRCDSRLVEAFKQDKNPLEINLSVGVYKDERANTILACGNRAEAARQRKQRYLSIEGHTEYAARVQNCSLAGHEVWRASDDGQTPGGTGGSAWRPTFEEAFSAAKV